MENQDRSVFVRTRLPWIVAAVALVLYVVTLNRWVSLASLPVVGAITDPNSGPPINGPLHFLLTYPFRWLPSGAQFIGLNLFAAVCAALTLALLARSVALLPHDRTREQRARERSESSLLSIPAAWAPPLFAALVCGLQLTFWEHATAFTHELLELLLFAYVIRCLLEYRTDQRESWLARAALIYGIAITNDYAMIGFFPVLLMALIWIKGLGFFEFRFLARLFGWGAAGLTLYLLTPALNALNGQSDIGFWQALRFELAGQKTALLFHEIRSIALWAALTSLLPLVLIGIRWPSTFGDTSAAGAILGNLMFRIVFALFLATGLWAAFDAPFSARVQVDRKLLQQIDEVWSGVSFLTFYYLGALCLGYFVGYFLLVFRSEAGKSWQRISNASRLVNYLVTAAVWVIVIGAPVGLLYKNLPAIRASNGSLLREFAQLTAQGLPTNSAIVLCDHSYLLNLVETSLQQSDPAGRHVLVSTGFLPYPAYQQALHKRFPTRWPALPSSDSSFNYINPVYLSQEVAALTQSNDVYYLHPSFGYYFESLYLQPHGLVYRLQSYATNAITPPSLTSAAIEENQKFWLQAGPALDRVAALTGNNLNDARVLGRWYSRALNWWGVELQKADRLDDATHAFATAKKLNPGNVAAEANLNFNETLRTHASKAAEVKESIEEKVGRYRDWNSLLAVNGPLDDPILCFRLGQTFFSQSLFRQSALQFIRVLHLEPDHVEARLWLANVYLGGRLPDKAIEVAGEIRAGQTAHPLNSTNQVELVRLEAMAYFGKGQTDTAEKLLLNARQQHPENEILPDALVQLYILANRLTNALGVIEEQLKLKPGNIGALLNKAYVCMKLESYDQANVAVAAVLKKDPDNLQALLDKGAICIQTKAYNDALAPLNQILKLQPDNQVALINRAIAGLQTGQLDSAKKDYETLLKFLPNEHRVHYGLGEIAYRQKNTSAAIESYEAYLKYAPTNSSEYKEVVGRLRELKTASR